MSLPSLPPRLRPSHRPLQRTTQRAQHSRPLGPCAATDCREQARVPVIWTPDPSSTAFRCETRMCVEHAVAGELAGTVTIIGA